MRRSAAGAAEVMGIMRFPSAFKSQRCSSSDARSVDPEVESGVAEDPRTVLEIEPSPNGEEPNAEEPSSDEPRRLEPSAAEPFAPAVAPIDDASEPSRARPDSTDDMSTWGDATAWSAGASIRRMVWMPESPVHSFCSRTVSPGFGAWMTLLSPA